jgi:hypothetical protein
MLVLSFNGPVPFVRGKEKPGEINRGVSVYRSPSRATGIKRMVKRGIKWGDSFLDLNQEANQERSVAKLQNSIGPRSRDGQT